jgi:hypothetical protein
LRDELFFICGWGFRRIFYFFSKSLVPKALGICFFFGRCKKERRQ